LKKKEILKIIKNKSEADSVKIKLTLKGIPYEIEEAKSEDEEEK